MKQLSKRQVVRNPSLITRLEPGESMTVQDRKGELVIMRKRRIALTPDVLEARVHKLTGHLPPVDVNEVLER
jgi:hypothetical protein